jgi:hypothetical protein
MIRRLIGIVAAVAQLGLVIAAGAESWHGRDASAHVERGGVSLHFAHDAATCVACTAQTLHAPEPTRPPLTIALVVGRARHTDGPAASLSSRPPLTNGSRAPPRLS